MHQFSYTYSEFIENLGMITEILDSHHRSSRNSLHVVLFLPGSSPLFYELSEQYEDVLPRQQSPPVVRVGEELISDHGRADEGQQCPSHVFMSRAMNRCNIAFSQNVKHGLRVSWDKPFALIHKNVSVYLWIHGNHCGTPQNVGPCLRNSVVSPKRGQPMVPGGSPFFMNLSSFHLNKAVLRMMHRPKTATKTSMKTAINGLPRSFQVPTTLRGRYGGLGWGLLQILGQVHESSRFMEVCLFI
nr:hypothetical protein GW17_00050486 [Ipomoea trifida]